MSQPPRLKELEGGAAARVSIAQMLLTQKRYGEAVQECERALGVDPLHATAHSTLAKALYMQERFEEAQRHCARALELDARLAEANELQGHLHYRSEEYEAADASYRRSCKAEPKAALSFLMRARIQRARGNGARACKLIEKALQIESGWSAGWVLLGEWRAEDGHPRTAKTALLQALEENPNSVHAHYQLGLIHLQEQDYGSAKAEFDAATETNPVIALAGIARGRWLIEQDRAEAAISFMDMIVQRFASWAPAHEALGDAHMAHGAAEAALACYEKALELDVALASAYSKRGLAKAALGREFEAILDLQEALQRDPGLEVTRIDLERIERPRIKSPTGSVAVAEQDRSEAPVAEGVR